MSPVQVSRLEELVWRFRTDLLRGERSSASKVVEYYGRIWGRLKISIDEVSKQIADAQARGENVTLDWLNRQSRYQKLQRQIEKEITEFAQYATKTVVQRQRIVIDAAQAHAKAYVSAQMAGAPSALRAAVVGDFNVLPSRSIVAMIGATSSMRSPVRRLFDGMGTQASRAIRDELISGIGLGLSPREIGSRLRQSFGGNLVQALKVARTETMRAYRTASHETFRENQNIVESWIWVSGADTRTCAACWAMHGTVHILEEPLSDHPNGRCVPVPKTKSWEELGEALDIDLGDAEAHESRVDVTKGDILFPNLSKEDQDRILGRVKGEAYRAGEFTLSQLPTYTPFDDDWGSMIRPKSLFELVGPERSDWWTRKVLYPQLAEFAKVSPGRSLSTLLGQGGRFPSGPDRTHLVSEWLMKDLSGGTVGSSMWNLAEWDWELVDGESRGYAKNELVTELSRRTGISYGSVNEFIAQWAWSSNDYDMRSLAIQRDAAELFGVPLSEWQASTIAKLEGEFRNIARDMSKRYKISVQEAMGELMADPSYKKYRPLFDSETQMNLLSAMNDYTQEELRRAGFTTIRVRRGVTVDRGVFADTGWEEGDRVILDLNTLSSWTVGERIGGVFANGTTSSKIDPIGVIFEMDVDVSQVMGSCRTGFGCLTEGEFILLGRTSEAKILKILRY